MEKFVRSFHVRWGDMDFNAHMRNTAFLDTSGDVRMMYFQERGFSMREFEQMRIGPVILKDELEYHRELKLLEQMEVSLELCGLSEDGSRFRVRNRFQREDGKLAAQVTSTGVWLNLESRHPVVPPDALGTALRTLLMSDDFATLPTAVRSWSPPAPL